jgi:hypothetical protein
LSSHIVTIDHWFDQNQQFSKGTIITAHCDEVLKTLIRISAPDAETEVLRKIPETLEKATL